MTHQVPQQREDIAFPGRIVAGRFGHHGTLCTASFCGARKDKWDQLVQEAQADGLSTACVFLPKGDENFGKHDENEETPGKCFCHALYGEPKFWGCRWFEQWRTLIHEAHMAGQLMVVFYLPGHLEKHGATHSSYPVTAHVEGELAWNQLASNTFEELKAMPGLGASQKGEVAWLKRQGIPFLRMDVARGAPDSEATHEIFKIVGEAVPLDDMQSFHEAMGWAARLFAIGAYQDAGRLYQRMIAAWQLRPEDDARVSSKIYRKFGDALNAAGQFGDAKAPLEAALSVAQRGLGDEDPETLDVMQELSFSLEGLGQHESSKGMRERVLVLRRRVHGEEHPETIEAMADLARSLYEVGQREEAKALREQILALSRKVQGEEHLQTLRAMNALAISLDSVGQVAEAKELQERVLAIRRRVQGEEHPLTIVAMNNLAVSLYNLGELGQATMMMENVEALRNQIPGATPRQTSTFEFQFQNWQGEMMGQLHAR